MGAFSNLIYQDLLIAQRQIMAWLNPVLFFIIVISLFPLAISPDVVLLHTIAPGLIWISALLAMLLSFNQLFHNDFEEGTLDLLLLSQHSLALLLLIKVTTHWLKTALPLIIVTPLLALLLHLTAYETLVLIITLLLGTPILSFIGALLCALTLSLRQNGVLLALLLLPLSIPVLIFAVSAVINGQSGQSIHAQLALLAAFLLFTLSLTPLGLAAALRIGIE
jgi:heme exporter protein B